MDATTYSFFDNPTNGPLYYHFDPPSLGTLSTDGSNGSLVNPVVVLIPSAFIAGSTHQVQLTTTSAMTGGPSSDIYPFTVPNCAGNAEFCDKGQALTTFQVGDADNFNPNPDSSQPTPSQAFLNALGNRPLGGFDEPGTDKHVTHTFLNLPLNIIRARLETNVRPNGGQSSNDAVGLYAPTILDQRYFGSGNSSPGLLSNAWTSANYPNGHLFQIDAIASLLTGMNNVQSVDVLIQDDSSVDYIKLQLCTENVAPSPDLAIIKKTPQAFVRGGTGTFDITVTNNGPGATSGTIVVTDPLVSGLTLTGYSASGWNCVSGIGFGGTQTCSYTGPPLTVGQSVTLTLTVAVAADFPGRGFKNCARVSQMDRGNQPISDPIPDNNESCIEIEITTAEFCDRGQTLTTLQAGDADNFNPNPDSSQPTPSQAFLTALGNRPLGGFDETGTDKHVTHTFPNLPLNIIRARLETNVRPNGGQSSNDAVGLYAPTILDQRYFGSGNSSPGLLLTVAFLA